MLFWLVFKVLAGPILCSVEYNTELYMVVDLGQAVVAFILRYLLLVCIGFVCY
jgi:hypothetical protein